MAFSDLRRVLCLCRWRWGRGVGLRLTNLVVPGGVSKQTRTQPTRREYDTARAKCRDKYQSDKCREGLRQSEASVATGPGTTNQSNPPTPTLAGVFHSQAGGVVLPAFSLGIVMDGGARSGHLVGLAAEG